MTTYNVQFAREFVEATAQNQWVVVDYPFTVSVEYLGLGFRQIPSNRPELTAKPLLELIAGNSNISHELSTERKFSPKKHLTLMSKKRE